MEIHCDNCKTSHQIGDKSINITHNDDKHVGRVEINCGCGQKCISEILIFEQDGELLDMDTNASGCTIYKKPNPKALMKKISKAV